MLDTGKDKMSKRKSQRQKIRKDWGQAEQLSVLEKNQID